MIAQNQNKIKKILMGQFLDIRHTLWLKSLHQSTNIDYTETLNHVAINAFDYQYVDFFSSCSWLIGSSC